MTNDELLELEKLSKKVSDSILKYKDIKLISHNDADGLSAAGIICNALYRNDILFHTSIVSNFDNSTLELIKNTSAEAIILCDMGSSQSEMLSDINNLIIIDHHKPIGNTQHLHFNPHLIGIDGSLYLSASGGAYMVARNMGNNTDLAGLAIVGATGDKQMIHSANKLILDEAVKNDVISIKKGICMGDAVIEELFEYSIEPYLDITGNKEKIIEFLNSLNIRGKKLSELSNDELKKLSSAIALKLIKQGNSDSISSLIGDIYILNNEVIHNVFDFVSILNSCGKTNKYGIALSICMGDDSLLDEAFSIYHTNISKIIDEINRAKQNINSAQNFRYVVLKDIDGTGLIASTMVRYLYPDKSFIAFNEVENMVKISARGTRKLVKSGLNLAKAVREAAIFV